MEMEERSNNKKRDIYEAELFEAISHPTRIKILRILNVNARGFAELKRKLGISSSGNLSHHLTKLVNLIEVNADGKYTTSDQGREALLAIDLINLRNKNWIATTYAAISALIFYGLFLTIAIISDLENLIGIPLGLIPIVALVGAFISFLIFRSMLIRANRRGTSSWIGTRKTKRAAD